MSLQLERLAYCSQAKQPDLALLTLAELLATADRNNARDGLTGVLLVSKGRFFQVLEGAAQDLDRTFARISADPRHRDVQIVQRRRLDRREFGAWAMVSARITPQQQPRIDAVIDDCHRDPQAAIDAARDLVERQRAA